MLDRFNRNINYLRISVTDRCNQQCYYCMPENRVNFIKVEHILAYEEIAKITAELVNEGISKVRLTGGEPLCRRGIVSLLSMLSKIDGIKDLSMTTNGVLLAQYAGELKESGLDRLNVSLDAVDRSEYKRVTGTDNLNDVISGLDAAVRAGFGPDSIKLNCVVEESSKEKNAREVAKFAAESGFGIRFIRMMDIEKGEFWPVEGGDGGYCRACNRLRLSSDGSLFPCLFSDVSFSVMELGIKEACRQALEHKPESGKFSKNTFYTIGG